jgi:hypothetical protein
MDTDMDNPQARLQPRGCRLVGVYLVSRAGLALGALVAL